MGEGKSVNHSSPLIGSITFEGGDIWLLVELMMMMMMMMMMTTTTTTKCIVYSELLGQQDHEHVCRNTAF